MTNMPKVFTFGKKVLCKSAPNIEKKILLYTCIYPNPETTSNFGLNDLKSCFWYKHNWKLTCFQWGTCITEFLYHLDAVLFFANIGKICIFSNVITCLLEGNNPKDETRTISHLLLNIQSKIFLTFFHPCMSTH